MAIHFGNDKIKEIYVGSDEIKEVYYGSELVWSGGFDGVFFPNGVEWQESRNHGGGSFDIGEKLILHADGVVASIETTGHYDISPFNILRVKWDGYRNPADDFSGISIRFLREGQVGSSSAPGVHYDRAIDPSNFSGTLIWDLSDVHYSGGWVVGAKYRIEVYIYGMISNKVAHCEIEELILLDEDNTNDGYWVHKDTRVRTYFGLDDPSIVGGIMSSPSWKNDCSRVKIPYGVTGLASYAFSGSTSLTSINIPEGVTSLGEACFYNCSSLTSITLPESVTSIERRAFTLCSSLTLATVLPATPPSLTSTSFNSVHTSFNIKVRSPYVDTYKTATNWSSYASKISAI